MDEDVKRCVELANAISMQADAVIQALLIDGIDQMVAGRVALLKSNADTLLAWVAP